ncbi:Ubiquitin-like-specific protease 1d [Thalictrum thalictroides]|uniref:Ubiquitin-like-specific protease 1d n=1 Tax=Thalictrum thalictroides TaxID=46969 RepID=A0A7J6W6M5_THATH|nr:Ubiquitin-like-specific protease 1d [Thalictrum thalictroides]
MEMESKVKKTPITLDWSKLTPMKENGPPPELVVVSGESEEQRQKLQQEIDHLSNLRDNELDDSIKRLRNQTSSSIGLRLPDKGAKLRIRLNLLEEEQKRRFIRKKEAEHVESTRSQKSCFPGSNGFSSEAPSSQPRSKSVFASIFSESLEKEPDLSNRISVDTSRKGILRLGHDTKQNSKSVQTSSNKGCKEIKATSRSSNCDGNKQTSPITTQKSFESSSFYGNCPSRSSKRRKTLEVQTLLRSRNKEHETVDLVDEDDCQLEETTHQEDEPVERMQDKIYYPSRDDPECVELHYSDIKCLAPQAFLSSTVMNFYIRYLQQTVSDSGRSRCDYHFFNTYFYGKIKEAVCCERNDKETFFSKFRRWWKGVNLFEKAYILLPIHESYHWSLVIICLPNKEDESGLTILHLDSLGYHDSGQIFRNVRSFLREEWNYVDKEGLTVPIPEKIWRFLTRRIDEKKITVPQQKNDYDCGIFVLYYMERFIDEVPERLRKKELPKFGRQWFKPEDASCLRGSIRKLLEKQFNNPKLENEMEETSPTPSSDDSAGSCKDVINI